MFIQTEATPNPATLKFLPGGPVLEHGTLDLRDTAQAEQSPLAQRLFGIPGVSGVFFGSDFITVTKSTGEWQQLKPMILGAIMEHFMSGAPLLTAGSAEIKDGEEFFDEEDAATVATIKELIETRVRPAVANDGGDHLPWFQGRRRLSQHERRVLRLSVLDRDAAARYSEPAAPFHSRRYRSPSDVIRRNWRRRSTLSL
jgi:Scaffold protein Nfu/NifU N terminal